VKPQAVAVLDVGKTNKKISIYDRRLQVLGEERATFEAREIDGIEVEDTAGLLGWFRTAMKRLTAVADIRAIAVTTHGATGALLDEAGNLAHPVISYTAAKGADVADSFYETFGDRLQLHQLTCTPDLGFANLGKMYYLVKTLRPEAWARARHALFYTSYLGYELTGTLGMESTYLGNHSYLWNFAENTWSPVAVGLGLDKMFPPRMMKSWDLLGTVKPELAAECGLSADCKVTQGIHDSNANYLPYLAQRERSAQFADFLLASTGTWCVLMRESDSLTLSREEAEAKVLFNMDALGRPVRTCIFPAGMDYDTFRAFSPEKDAGDMEALRRVIAERKLFVVPGVLPDSTAFPGSPARVVDDDCVYALSDLRQQSGTPFAALGQDYFAALNLGLALATKRQLGWSKVNPGTSVFIEGGFCKNALYCALLAALCPEQKFHRTSMAEGTSFGAALTAWMLAEDLTLDAIGREFSIETSAIAAPDFGPELAAYEEAFLALVR